MKDKKCKACGLIFTPERQFQTTCGYKCAIDYARLKQKQNLTKQKNKAVKQLKENDIPTLKRLAQTLVNKYIRERDKLLPCVSCGYNGDDRQWHAGHYMPMGNNGSIRYDESNIWKQCSVCNNHLSGNLANYRLELIKRIGLKKVEWLESQKEPKKWSVEELKEIIKTYKNKLKINLLH